MSQGGEAKLSGRGLLVGLGVVVVIGTILLSVAWYTGPTRAAVHTYTAILGAANRQDVEGARALCTARYRNAHSLKPAHDGGLVGLPRNIHKNFQVWREGPNVWLCPTNRVGPVYQFVNEDGSWRFDGPVGLLRPGGQVVRMPDTEVSDMSEP